jgi:hypothetical protein
MSADATAQSEVIIACNPNAIPAEKRERWLVVATQMYGAVQEVQELPDGYAFGTGADTCQTQISLVAEKHK